MTPRASYRLQFSSAFTFGDAIRIVPYLARLGVSHVYASPILTARAGSTHGYDLVDPTRINPEIGGEAGFRAFVGELQAHDLSLLVDIVPNHMGVGGGDNAYWLDVLRHGARSRYINFFDIDWTPLDRSLTGKVLAPFLGDPYGHCLANGDLRLRRDKTFGWAVFYHHHVFPIRDEDAALLDEDPDNMLAAHDADAAEGRAKLHELLERQHYRLAWFRTAGDMINWRRFFDVTELATLQADRSDVFDICHELILNLYAEGLIDGLRVDHVDGLADPASYCRRLRAALDKRQGERPEGRRERAWMLVEKILAVDEALDPSWQTDGTTGYDFMNEVSLLQHNNAGVALLSRHWAARTGRPEHFGVQEREARREIVVRSFTAQLDSAVDALGQIANLDTNDRDLSRAAMRRCLVEILGCFPRYRSYVAQEGGADDLAEPLRRAIAAARPLCFPADREHLDRLVDWLGAFSPELDHSRLRRLAIRRFEQLSAPVAAKAVEDTAFYRHGPLLSRNDVGFNPDQGGGSAQEWHRACEARAVAFPQAMLATATHDHKRGEDVRARLAVLSEQPQAWVDRLDRWLDFIASVRADETGQAVDPAAELAVDPADIIMLLQTVVGIWPVAMSAADLDQRESMTERLLAWQLKALREAKVHTSWEAPNEAYEAVAAALTRHLMLDESFADLRIDIIAFADFIAPFARDNTMGQTVLRLTAPGVPDIYQGTEFLDLSLVDPDNRRPVDYALRADTLGSGADTDDAVKQRMIARLLHLRKEAPDLFANGDYIALEIVGDSADACVAFARRAGPECLVVIVRLATRPLADGAAIKGLPAGHDWRDVLADESTSRARSGWALKEVLGDAAAVVLYAAPLAED